MTEKVYLFLLALAGTTLVALALFTYPAADDFCFQEKVGRLGFAGAQADWYTTWFGRYTASALMSWLMLAGTAWYPLAAVLVLLTWLASIWLLLRAVLGDAFPRRTVLIAAGTGFVMYGAFAPSANGAFYWASAALPYQVGATLLLLVLAINIRRTRAISQGRPTGSLSVPVAANVLLGLALAGTNETAALLAIMLLAAGAGLARRLRQRAILPWLVGLVSVAIGLAIVILAPGNDVRLQHFPEGQNLFRALYRTAAHTLGFIVRESANPALWLAAALVAAPLWSILSDSTRDWMVRRRGWLVLLALWVAMIAACFFPANYAMGAGPPRRAVNLAFVVILLGWIPVATALAERFWAGRHFFLPSPHVRPLLLLALGLSLAGGSQMREMYKDLGNGPGFREELVRREEVIRMAAKQGIREVEVPPLRTRPKHLYFVDLARNPAEFQNQCLAGVFGLKTIRIVDTASGH